MLGTDSVRQRRKTPRGAGQIWRNWLMAAVLPMAAHLHFMANAVVRSVGICRCYCTEGHGNRCERQKCFLHRETFEWNGGMSILPMPHYMSFRRRFRSAKRSVISAARRSAASISAWVARQRRRARMPLRIAYRCSVVQFEHPSPRLCRPRLSCHAARPKPVARKGQRKGCRVESRGPFN